MNEKLFLVERKNIIGTDNHNLVEVIHLYQERSKPNEDYNDEMRKYLLWDYELMLCTVINPILDNNYKKEYLRELYGFKDGGIYPDLKKFEIERISFYEYCLENTLNLFMKIRYLEYLIVYGNKDKKRDYVVQFIKYSLLIDTETHPNYMSFISNLSRCIEMSIKYSILDKINILEQIIISEVKKFVKEENYRHIVELSRLTFYMFTHKKKLNLQDQTKQLIVNSLSISKEHYSREMNLFLFKYTTEELYKWFKLENKSDSILFDLLFEIGLFFEKESEYQSNNSEKNAVKKAYFIEESIKYLIAITSLFKSIEQRDKIKRKIDQLKVDLKKTYRDVEKEKKGFITQQIEFPVDKESIGKYSDIFLNNSRENKNFVNFMDFSIPDLDVDIIKNDTNALFEKIKLGSIISTQISFGGRKVFEATNEDENRTIWLFEHYRIILDSYFSIYYKETWEKLTRNGLTEEILNNRICNWIHLMPNNQLIIRQGIKRFFEKDYVSCLHILVPQFENALRVYFELGGYPTTSIKNGIQKEQTFNEFLTNSFVKENLDKDFLFLIKFVMVEQLGFNLRNDLAHGLVAIGMLNRNTCLIIIYLYFQLTKHYWENREKENVISVQ